MNVAWRFSKHAYYKKLCACASLGELSAEGRDKLNRHLKSCAACSKIYVDYADINAALTPEVSDDEEIIAGLEASTRTAVLESIAACERETKFKGEPTLVRSAAESTSPSSRSARARVLRWSAASALAVFSSLLGLGTRHSSFVEHTKSQGPRYRNRSARLHARQSRKFKRNFLKQPPWKIS